MFETHKANLIDVAFTVTVADISTFFFFETSSILSRVAGTSNLGSIKAYPRKIVSRFGEWKYS